MVRALFRFSVRVARTLLIVAGVLCLAVPTGAQQTQGSVTGTVSDPLAARVAGAMVTLIRQGKQTAETLSDARGEFSFGAIESARYQISVSATGFEPQTTAPFFVGAGPTTVDVSLQIGALQQDVVVTAAATELPQSQVGAQVTVIDRAALDNLGKVDVLEAIRTAPGLQVVQAGARGGATSLLVRGGNSNFNKILVDGVPANDIGGGVDLSQFATTGVERVEILREANSVLYGSDALTGVVSLSTRRGQTAVPELIASIDGGNLGTNRQDVSVGGVVKRFDYFADGYHFKTDNSVPNNAFRNLTLTGIAGAALNDTASLRFVGRLERGKTGVPGQTAFGRPDMDAYSQRHDGTWGVSFDQTLGALRQHASYGLAISHQVSTNLIADPPFTPAYGNSVGAFEFSDFTYDSRSDLRRHRASYQVDGTFATRSAGTHVDTALVDWDGERAELRDVLAGTTVPASRDNVGVTLQHQALWSRVFVTAGVRFEHNDSFGNEAVPRVSGAWFVRAGGGRVGATRVTASAGTGIKEPTVIQSFSPSPYFQGNPDLQPERTRAVDVGIEQRLADDRVRVNWTWFDNRYEDIISLRTDFTTFQAQYFNIGLTTARGMELGGDVALTSGFRGRASYTFTDSEIVESTSDNEAFQPFCRVPRIHIELKSLGQPRQCVSEVLNLRRRHWLRHHEIARSCAEMFLARIRYRSDADQLLKNDSGTHLGIDHSN